MPSRKLSASQPFDMTEHSKTFSESVQIEKISSAHAQVLEVLHRTSFESPWAALEFVQLLNHPGTGGLIALNAQTTPLGFILVRSAGDEVEILTLCVDPQHRGQKIATRILNALIADCNTPGRPRIFLEVGQNNQPALGLYQACGFNRVGERPGYYRKRGNAAEAAIIMAYS